MKSVEAPLKFRSAWEEIRSVPFSHAPPELELFQLPPRAGAPDEFRIVAESFDVCVLFTPNGVWKERFLICGMVEIINNVEASRPLFRELKSCFASEYIKGKNYIKNPTYVGPSALALYGEGYRLCDNPNLTTACDYKPSNCL